MLSTKNILNVEISQHIKDLLLTHDRVILSDFGAFIAKYSPAKIDSKTNTMAPPGKEIVFDSTILKDGGLLARHISEKENISEDEASKQISEFVKTVKSKLSAGKTVKFTELGSFSKIKGEGVFFHYQPSGNLLLNSYGLQNISLPEDVVKNIEKPIPDEVDGKTKKKRKGLIIAMSIVAFLAIALTAIYFLKPDYWEKGKNYIVSLFESDKKEKVTPRDTIKKEVVVVVDSNTNNKPDTTDNNNKPDSTNDGSSDQYTIPQKGKIYLFIASLHRADVAERQQESFRRRGIETFIVPSGGRYRLAVGRPFGSTQAANDFYHQFHSNPNHKKYELWAWNLQ